MSFEEREESDELGSPIELFTFRLYETNHNYTNASEDQTIDGVTYTAATIERSEIFDSGDMEKQDLELTVAPDFPILQLYDSAPPSDIITLTIKCIHRGDTEVATFWNGRVTSGIRRGSKGILYCENIFTSLRRTGLRRPYSKLCPHQLYGRACGLNKENFKVTALVDAVDGIEIQSSTLADYPNGRFAGGLVEFTVSSGIIIRRGIKSHDGNTILVTHPIEDLEALDEISVYPGCKHNLQDCDETFDNAVNYGGWPFIPKINPMGQSSVF